jgi:4-amino-4-deoxy-L-arabinose transferase-like glycosyltransferase
MTYSSLPEKIDAHKIRWWALGFFLLALGFYALWLWQPNRLYWDEMMHVNGARTILYGKRPYSAPIHPPLGREILFTSLFFFGDSPLGARILSTLAGAGGLAIVFLIAFQLTQNLGASALSAFTLFVENLYYLHARMGMLDIFVTFFMILSLWIFLKIRSKDPPLRRVGHYYLLGSSLGLGFAVKVLAGVLYPIFFIPLLISVLKINDSSMKRGHLFHLFLGFLVPTLFFFLASLFFDRIFSR